MKKKAMNFKAVSLRNNGIDTHLPAIRS